MAKPLGLSAKVIVRDETGCCLLLKRSLNSKGNPGKWDLPGGKIAPGESFEQGLLREVTEETGLTISIQRVVGVAESESPTTKIVYLILEGRLESGQVRLSSEHDEYVWVNRRELSEMALADQFLAFAQAYSEIDV